jgi:predicted RNase H-like nuclease
MSSRGVVEAFIGFDSSWTDNRKRPGAISSVTAVNGEVCRFTTPELIGFERAASFINEAAARAEFTLVAIDQPTIVPNSTSCRPAERVTGSVVNAIGGGVQPANRSKAAMFGEGAPIWRLLDRLGARQNPPAARGAATGCFVIEVFPALALTAIAPETWERRRAAKYNPANRLFTIDDWHLVARAVARAAEELGAADLAGCAMGMAGLPKPRKGAQDRLDSLICLVVALQWRRLAADRLAVIGDGRQGYIVTPVTSRTRDILARAADRLGVSMDASWAEDARHEVASARW